MQMEENRVLQLVLVLARWIVGLVGGQVRVLFLHLQDGVLLHLLLDPFLQRQDRQLEDLHRLDHPGSQFLGLLLR